jgi:hypothetical protein
MVSGSQWMLGIEGALIAMKHKICCFTFLLTLVIATNCLAADGKRNQYTTFGTFDSAGLTSKVYLVFINTDKNIEVFYLDERTDHRYFNSKPKNSGRPVKIVWRYGKSYDTPYFDESKIIKSIRFLK